LRKSLRGFFWWAERDSNGQKQSKLSFSRMTTQCASMDASVRAFSAAQGKEGVCDGK